MWACSAESGELWRGAKASVGARRAAREPEAGVVVEDGAGAEAGMMGSQGGRRGRFGKWKQGAEHTPSARGAARGGAKKGPGGFF